MAKMPEPRVEEAPADDLYDGPAALVADDGTEIPVHARLWLWREFHTVPDGQFARDVPAGWRWRGILEAEQSLVGRQLPLPGTVRLPDGREGTFAGMSSDGDKPNRVEIEGRGPVPWTEAA